MIITTAMVEHGGVRRPDLPQGIDFSVVVIDGDRVQVKLQEGSDTQAAERHAAALGLHVPASVRSERFWLALLNLDEALFDQAEALIEQHKAYRVAARQAPTISRNSQTVAAIQQALSVSDETLDAIFCAAALIET